MKSEDEPVSDDESVIRLVWHQFLRLGELVPILPVAFKPRADETDGISVFRAACLATPTDALAAMLPEKRGGYAVALIPVTELAALGLTVRPSKIEAVSGHAVIPQLNIVAVEGERHRWKAVQIALAQVAARTLVPPAGM